MESESGITGSEIYSSSEGDRGRKCSGSSAKGESSGCSEGVASEAPGDCSVAVEGVTSDHWSYRPGKGVVVGRTGMGGEAMVDPEPSVEGDSVSS